MLIIVYLNYIIFQLCAARAPLCCSLFSIIIVLFLNSERVNAAFSATAIGQEGISSTFKKFVFAKFAFADFAKKDCLGEPARSNQIARNKFAKKQPASNKQTQSMRKASEKQTNNV